MPTRGWRRAHLPLFKTETSNLQDFIDEVCRYSFGAETVYKELIPSKRELVLVDIANALETGRVGCCVHLLAAPLEGQETVLVQFMIERSYWANEDAVAELKRFLSPDGNIVPLEYLHIFIGNIKFYLEQKYHNPLAERHNLKIVEPQKIFQDLVDFDVLPSSEWFTRYAKYRQDFTWELIAVAWRYIALQTSDVRISIEKLANHLEAYLEIEGLDPKRLPKHHKIYQIARNVLDQRSRSDLNSPVGVSTNPARPQISVANKKRLQKPLS